MFISANKYSIIWNYTSLSYRDMKIDKIHKK